MQPIVFTEYQLNRQAYVRKRINVVQRVHGFDACWEWRLRIDPAGYGHSRYGGHNVGAHRCSYMAFVGPIPGGLTLDHLCNNRCCVNPSHLEPVTLSVNAIRAVARDRANGTGHWNRLAVCSKGLHTMTGDNIQTQMVRGYKKRMCRECGRERQRQFHRDHPEKAAQYEATRRAKLHKAA